MPDPSLAEMAGEFITQHQLQSATSVFAIDSRGVRVDFYPDGGSLDPEAMLTAPIMVVVVTPEKRVGFIVDSAPAFN